MLNTLRTLFVVLGLFVSVSSQAITLSPADQIRFDSLGFECGKPGKDCPQKPVDEILDIEFIQAEEEYTLNGIDTLVASEDGLLVTLMTESKKEGSEGEWIEVTRFYSLAKVGLSPDKNYYLCENGSEYKLKSEVDLDSYGMTNTDIESVFFDGYRPQAFICNCFWAPKKTFDDLGVTKLGKTPKPEEPEDPIYDPIIPIGGESPKDPIFDPDRPYTEYLPPIEYFFFPDPKHPYHPPHTPIVPKPVPIAPVNVGGSCGLFAFPWVKCE